MPTPDEDESARARSRVGTTLAGKYRIERVLGSGGMASVYAAVHRNGRRVAVKMLHPELARRADIRKRFLLEGHAANAVKHPGAVVAIDDDVAEDGAPFLVMELLDGQSIEDLSLKNGGPLPAKMVLALGRELCDVLAAAHAAGIVHRDIKPANLFVTVDGQVKVLDFGLARLRDVAIGAKATATGLVFGTPAFLPPEQAAGRVSQIDERTDVWAVGATLFTLLSGVTVHEGESAQHLVMLAATTPPRSLASVLPDAPSALVAVVDRALAFDKEERWGSARDMRAAICSASKLMFGDPRPQLVEMSDMMEVTVTAVKAVHPRRAADARVLVGTRTSQPVSSSPITKVKAEARHDVPPGLILAVRKALSSGPMTSAMWRKRAQVAVGGGLTIAAILIAVIVFGLRRWSARDDFGGSSSLAAPTADPSPAPAADPFPAHATTPAPSSSPAEVEPPRGSPSLPPPAPPPAVMITGSTAEAAPPPTGSAAEAAPPPTASVIIISRPSSPMGRPTSPAVTAGAAGAPAAAATPRPSARPGALPTPTTISRPKSPGCAEDYVVDSKGKKIWKPECL